MSEETIQETETVGEILKEAREKAKLSLHDAHEATKIPLKVLEAIERDDFSCMPAEAFCRGFYVMYAKYLTLDSDSILSKYLEARGLPPVTSTLQSTPPVHKSGKFRSYAEPSSISFFMRAILTLVVILLAVGTVCWYLHFDLVGFINNKLNPQDPSTQETPATVVSPRPVNDTAEEVVLSKIAPQTDTAIEDVSEQTTKEPPPVVNAAPSTETVETAPSYHLEMGFRNSGTLTITLDDGFAIEKQYHQGESFKWDVKEKVTLDLPKSTQADIHFNGVEVPLPPAQNGRRLLSLPEDLLN